MCERAYKSDFLNIHKEGLATRWVGPVGGGWAIFTSLCMEGKKTGRRIRRSLTIRIQDSAGLGCGGRLKIGGTLVEQDSSLTEKTD